MKKPGTTRRVLVQPDDLTPPWDADQDPGKASDVALDRMLKRMFELKEEARAFELRNGSEFAKLEAEAIKHMTDRRLKKYEGGDMVGTLVAGESTVVDWDGIEKVVPKSVWETIAPRKGRPELLDAALKLKTNRLLLRQVKRFITTKPIKPYIKTAEKKG